MIDKEYLKSIWNDEDRTEFRLYMEKAILEENIVKFINTMLEIYIEETERIENQYKKN